MTGFRKTISVSFVVAALIAILILVSGSAFRGEHLAIRFLGTTVLAAAGLYVVSDLRLRAANEFDKDGMPIEVAPAVSSTSTAAFMATVSRRTTENEAIHPNKASTTTAATEKTADRPSPGQSAPNEPLTMPPDVHAVQQDTQNSFDSTVELQSKHSANNSTDQQDHTKEKPIDASSDTPNTQLQGTATLSKTATVETQPDEVSVPSNQVQNPATVDTQPDEYQPTNNPEPIAKIDRIPEISDDLTETTIPSPDNLTDLIPQPNRASTEDRTQPDIARAFSLFRTPAETTAAPEPPATPPNSPTYNPNMNAINEAIRLGESAVIERLIAQGVLSSEGPVTDEDVSTIVYVAFTSSELRQILGTGGDVHLDPDELATLQIFANSADLKPESYLVAGPQDVLDRIETNAKPVDV